MYLTSNQKYRTKKKPFPRKLFAIISFAIFSLLLFLLISSGNVNTPFSSDVGFRVNTSSFSTNRQELSSDISKNVISSRSSAQLPPDVYSLFLQDPHVKVLQDTPRNPEIEHIAFVENDRISVTLWDDQDPSDTSPVSITLHIGVHLWSANPLPPRLPQLLDIQTLYPDIDMNSIKFQFPVPSKKLPFVVLGVRPVILYFPRVLTDEECDHLIAVAKPQMFRSQVAPHRYAQDTSSVSDIRTSHQAWILDGHDHITRRIAQRLTDIVGIPSSEATQILRYGKGQKYLAHHDFFDPNLYGHQDDNRAATFYLYLSDVPPFGGGDTYFPRAFGQPDTGQYANCSAGVRVFPRKGAAVIFYDALPDGRLDPYSLHGSCPVEVEGVVKWGGTKWFRVPTGLDGPIAVWSG